MQLQTHSSGRSIDLQVQQQHPTVTKGLTKGVTHIYQEILQVLVKPTRQTLYFSFEYRKKERILGAVTSV